MNDTPGASDGGLHALPADMSLDELTSRRATLVERKRDLARLEREHGMRQRALAEEQLA
jgi:hypothetical protein